MNKITPFLWFNDNAEDAAEFYLSVFPEAKKVGELPIHDLTSVARTLTRPAFAVSSTLLRIGMVVCAFTTLLAAATAPAMSLLLQVNLIDAPLVLCPTSFACVHNAALRRSFF